MRYLIILFLLCGSCSTRSESGDYIGTSKFYAETRHEYNFRIWKAKQKNIAGIASFKKEVSCPEEAHR
tara:strand:+ start:303 stop:506 length:204 start_codon:yes stop_codon:yes gene_type:complete